MPEIVAMLRVKNEGRWLREVLIALNCCDQLFVLDDHSTDDTAAIARECGAHVFPSPFETKMDEARDKDYLLSKVQERIADGGWCLCIDGDEVLEPGGGEKVKALAQSPANAYQFRVLYLWDSREQIRMDGVYAHFSRPSMFKLARGLTFARTDAYANLHCSSVPGQYIDRRCVRPSDVALLHLGYMHKADRLRKYDWYSTNDSKNPAEDGYRHIVIGDLFPADSRFRHGGPLLLEPLEALCTVA